MAPVWSFFKPGNLPHMLLLAVAVGLGGGVAAVVFHYLIDFFTWLFYGVAEAGLFVDTVEGMAWYWRLLIPALGGLLVGLIIKFGRVTEAQGHGVPEVMEAVALQQGTVRFRVAPLKALTAALSIGSGGSAGREGPIIQIGSAVGSNIGRWFNLRHEQTLTLLAAGAAAGVGGTFGAPLAGIVFAWEVLLRRLTVARTAVLMTAALTGTYLARTALDFSGPFFPGVVLSPVAWSELLLFAGLGVIAGVVAVFYDNILHVVERVFRSSRFPFVVRPALGGLLFGTITLMVPNVHETASTQVLAELLIVTSLSVGTLLLIMLAKIFATAFTLGSGGSGGIFAPALFIGATLGSAYGLFLADILPIDVAPATAYALVGMAALFGAAAHAPLTAFIIVLEMTVVPTIIAPLAVACVVSVIVAKFIQSTNIYSIELADKGVDIDRAYIRLDHYFRRGE